MSDHRIANRMRVALDRANGGRFAQQMPDLYDLAEQFTIIATLALGGEGPIEIGADQHHRTRHHRRE
jgi:hypothetical protein